MITKANSVVRRVTRPLLFASVLACVALCGAAEEDSRWVHPLCQPLPIDSDGPFAELADGSLMTIDAQGVRVSQDDGKTWSDNESVRDWMASRRPRAGFVLHRADARRCAGHRLSGFHHVQLQLGQNDRPAEGRLPAGDLGDPQPGRRQDLDRPAADPGGLQSQLLRLHPNPRRPTGCHGAAPGTRPGPLRGVLADLGRRREDMEAEQLGRPGRPRRPLGR